LRAISRILSISVTQVEYRQTMKILRHHSLIAWQRADLFIKVHQLATTRLPAVERFELAIQGHYLRAGQSLHFGEPTNVIVMGMAGNHDLDVGQPESELLDAGGKERHRVLHARIQ
jgi:hypothetical protein